MLIRNFETWSNQPVQRTKDSLKLQVTAQDQYMQSPLAMAIYMENLLKALLERLNVSELHQPVSGLF